MVFHDLVQDERFDLWIADEAWEVDYFLHENPGLKTAPYVWLTDFVGVLPMPEGGEREAFLAADYNAQMVEHVAAHPAPARPLALHRRPGGRRAPAPSARGCRRSANGRASTSRFTGYVTGFDAAEPADRESAARRARLRATGRGSASSPRAARPSGAPLLERAVAAFPEAQAAHPGVADDRRRGPAHRPGARCRSARGSRRPATCTGSTGSWRPAISRSATAGSPRRWS